MKIAVWILKILILILTAIWGIIFGIFAPLAIHFGGIVDEAIAGNYIITVWLLNSIICYIGGTVLLMLNKYKIAMCFHIVGLAVSLFVYATFESLYVGHNASNPAVLYMPVVFISILSIILCVIANWKKIDARLKNANKKDYEEAPSILGGTYKAEKEKGKKK